MAATHAYGLIEPAELAELLRELDSHTTTSSTPSPSNGAIKTPSADINTITTTATTASCGDDALATGTATANTGTADKRPTVCSCTTASTTRSSATSGDVASTSRPVNASLAKPGKPTAVTTTKTTSSTPTAARAKGATAQSKPIAVRQQGGGAAQQEIVIVDVRGKLRPHIRGANQIACHEFLRSVDAYVAQWSTAKRVVFHCQHSQVRGPQCAGAFVERLRTKFPSSETQVLLLTGGFTRFEHKFGKDKDLVVDT
ncbi:hypothetical protein Pelo_3553 [Pelomyxa schiedti]|nr:hypothetical protein Pelo_3553 [Pelomyxa schiedti]